MFSAIRRAWGNEQFRFLAIGAVNTGVGYGLFVLLQISIGKTVTYMGSLVLSHIFASVLAYYLYRKIVFKVVGNLWLDFLRFQLVYAGSFGANLVLLPTLVSGLGWSPLIAQACSVIVIAFSSYVGHKWFTFRRTPEKISALEATERAQKPLP